MDRRVLVYGGCGALGRTVVDRFIEVGCQVISIDLSVNEQANCNVVIDKSNLEDCNKQHEAIMNKLAELLEGDKKLDGIFCVAGGWAGGNAASKDYIKNCDMMWKQSVWSSIIAGNIAAKHLKENGVLTLTGAAPALAGTPGMIGYGMAKAAVQHLTKSLACTKESGLPDGSCVACILPVTLDTPMNRKWMAKADFSTWTPLKFVAELFHTWSFEVGCRPDRSGSLVKIVTKDSVTSTSIAE